MTQGLAERARRLGLLGVLLVLVAGCATSPADDSAATADYEEANDPLEPLNRTFFEFNRGLDALLLRPVAHVYRDALPAGVRNSARNVLRNLRSPVIFANDLLQGEPDRAAQTAARFSANTLAGFGGIGDVAAGEAETLEQGGIPYHDEDFGQTLGVWGVGEGFYLVLPFIGPSSARDAAGLVVDSLLDPFAYIVDADSRLIFSATRRGLAAVDFRSRNLESLDEIERTSIDFYATVRSLYRQRRAAEIRNGEDELADNHAPPDIDIDFEDDEKAEDKLSSLPKE
jgi:phospholipid-binding lipoprotein MlaA